MMIAANSFCESQPLQKLAKIAKSNIGIALALKYVI